MCSEINLHLCFKVTLQNDLALIKLSKDADLSTSFVSIIPLEGKGDINELTKCDIGGWGQVSSGELNNIVN